MVQTEKQVSGQAAEQHSKWRLSCNISIKFQDNFRKVRLSLDYRKAFRVINSYVLCNGDDKSYMVPGESISFSLNMIIDLAYMTYILIYGMFPLISHVSIAVPDEPQKMERHGQEPGAE